MLLGWISTVHVCLFLLFFPIVLFLFLTLPHSLTPSLPPSLTHSLTHSLTLSLPPSITQSLTHSLTPSLPPSLPLSLTHSLPHSLTHSLTLSLPPSLTHSLTPSLLQFADSNFASLSGVRVVRIAVHPDLQGMGYGSQALRCLHDYYQMRMTSLAEGAGPQTKTTPTIRTVEVSGLLLVPLSGSKSPSATRHFGIVHTIIIIINPLRACARVTVRINPLRACARVTVIVLSVCLCVCFPYSGTSRVQTAVSATSARYGHEI